MTASHILKIIQQGESKTVEFKTSKDKLNKDTFETICAFLNRNGGHIILGVNDKKEIVGVNESAIPELLDTIAKNANNPQKLSPPYYFSPEIIEIEDKKVIVIFIPESSQVHNTAGKIFDRNEDGDFNITNNPELITQLYLRKQNTYTENKVFPFAKIEDFKSELFDKVRKLVSLQKPNHPWLSLTNEELLKSAGLYKQDVQTGQSGFTLAGILLLGNDEIILNALPHHKTDAILRRENLDRYDDRDDIRINLLESYERLMNFVNKHLPDRFYQEGTQRINLRDHIFREVIGNLLIHREYANAYPAKLIIEKTKVIAENWNKPHGHGNIDPANFTPYPKNPMIARFFKEIGWVDELGSGVRKISKYTRIYTKKGIPEFTENDVFKTSIPLASTNTKSSVKILKLISENQKISITKLSKELNISTRAVEKQLSNLKETGKLERIGANKGGYWKVVSK
jgi:ATP-dependent DNA helicase RecG